MTAPIILIGMHRSGTSMLAKMLEKLGLFIGWDLQSDYEATFFSKRNERILNVCGGSWQNPEVIYNLTNQTDIRGKAIEFLQNDLSSTSRFSYLGPKYFFKYGSIKNLDFPWCWKDPRNTFLLPIWLDIFPEAKIVHIFRNGIDVAQSLTVRDVKGLDKVLFKNKFYRRHVKLLKEKGWFKFFIMRFDEIYKKIDPINKYNRLKLHNYMTIEDGFSLWCKYIEQALYYSKNLQNKILDLKYEEFLQNPEENLKKLVQFCNLECDPKQIKMEALNVNPERCYAYQKNEFLMRFYNKVKDNQLMLELGYNV